MRLTRDYRPVPNLFSIAINFFERLYVAGFFFLQLCMSTVYSSNSERITDHCSS
jgi:hypothetical protein